MSDTLVPLLRIEQWTDGDSMEPYHFEIDDGVAYPVKKVAEPEEDHPTWEYVAPSEFPSSAMNKVVSLGYPVKSAVSK